MGIDWYPFRLKSEASKTEFGRMVVAQRRHFLEWYCNGSEDFPAAIEKMIDFGHADEMPEHIDAVRIVPVAGNPVFPASWKHDLFTTCFPEDAGQVVQKYRRGIESLRTDRLSNYLKLRYIEWADFELETAWNDLRERARRVRNRNNNWTRKESVLRACQQIETLASPRLFEPIFFAPYWKTLDTSPWNDPVGPTELDEILSRLEKTVQEFTRHCHDWNRAVKAEKCHCFAESFDSFRRKMDDPFLDEFFEWTAKWLSRDYGMYLSY